MNDKKYSQASLDVLSNMVLAERSLLFYKPEDGDKTGGTLSGNKKKVYVLLKIMKKIFNADITSFKV